MDWILALLILFPPLLASGLMALSYPSVGERCALFGIGGLTLSFGAALVTLVQTIRSDAPGPLTLSVIPHPFTPVLLIDRLSAVMMVLITGIGLIIHVYSRRYMHDDPGYGRFFSLLSVLTWVLLCLVTSGHLLWLAIWWHGVTWLLRALLAFHADHPAARRAGTTTLRVQSLGDAALLLAALAGYSSFGTFDLRSIFHSIEQTTSPAMLFPGTWAASTATDVMAVILVLAIMTKSAQFPLHVWLTGTIEAPTPVSAMLHAGIVNAGGFLVNRLAPLFGAAPDTLHLLFIVGAVTALIGAASMLTQPSIKRTLVYSTVGQMGYMVMECGLGAFALAIFHLCAHGLFKATLFLNSGAGIHKARTDFLLPEAAPSQAPTSFSLTTWATGLTVTLFLPLAILLAAHGMVHIPLFEAQSTLIFLFFAWVTSSQAVFSLYRPQAAASWKVSLTMVAALAVISLTYLWAGEAFTHFLYPEESQATAYFQSAAWPQWLFDAVISLSALGVVTVWAMVYGQAHGHQMLLPAWLEPLKTRAYVACLNALYVEEALRGDPGRRRIPARAHTERIPA